MATDYDAPRRTDDAEDGTEEVEARRAGKATSSADLDDGDNGPLDLPGADPSGEELSVLILPRQADEFTCSNCFLVHHRSRLARRQKRAAMLCSDCA